MNNFWLFPLLAILALPLHAEVTQYDYKVIHKTEQTRDYFVQGFEFADKDLLVGTGGYGQSFIYRINPKTGDVKNKVALHPRLFGEGITVLNDRVYQLTWRSRMGFIYHLEDFKPIARFRLHGEGWGLTNNGEQLILSDGSARLTFLDPKTLQVKRSLRITENGKAVNRLNELEWIEGKIWANIWMADRLVIIDPETGEVEGRVNLSGLLPLMEYRANTDVLNGIAWDAKNQALWVTGKRWPWRYQIELIPKNSNRSVTRKPTS